MLLFFQQTLQDIKNIFSIKNLVWHFLAIIITYFLVITDFDWNFFIFTQKHSFQNWFFPAIILGGFLPFLLSFYFLFFKENKEKFFKIGLTILEAVILAILISGFYKAFTGRLQPENGVLDLNNLENISHNFRFGFWRGGVFWGWPSTHTTISFAFSSVLYKLFSKNKLVKILVITYAFYIGIGVSITAIHWFSEFVAGAIIGSIIGIVVGKNFQEKN